MNQVQRRQEFEEYDDEEWEEVRTCERCSHFDEINQCCWVVASDGICRDVRPYDYCVFGFKEERY